MLNKKSKFSKGFGILEVLISSAIIIVVLGTLVFIAQSSLTNAAYMQERAQAVSLAAEAIETVRQNRDSNYIDLDSTTKWNTVGSGSNADVFSLLSSPSTNNVFYIPFDFISRRLRLNNSLTLPINIDGVNYTRKIMFYDLSKVGSSELMTKPVITTDNSKNGFLVSVQVTWKGSGGKTSSAQVEETITNSRFVY